jgi:hypothetical protein
MHIPPVHNRCALDFVIGGICLKSHASQADAKPQKSGSAADAEFEPPLYTMRGRANGVRRQTPPAPPAAIKEQP